MPSYSNISNNRSRPRNTRYPGRPNQPRKMHKQDKNFQENQECAVFIGCIDKHQPREVIYVELQKYGYVKKLDLPPAKNGAFKNNGFCFVHFRDAESARKLLEAEVCDLDGAKCEVKPYQRGIPAGSYANTPRSVTPRSARSVRSTQPGSEAGDDVWSGNVNATDVDWTETASESDAEMKHINVIPDCFDGGYNSDNTNSRSMSRQSRTVDAVEIAAIQDAIPSRIKNIPCPINLGSDNEGGRINSEDTLATPVTIVARQMDLGNMSDVQTPTVENQSFAEFTEPMPVQEHEIDSIHAFLKNYSQHFTSIDKANSVMYLGLVEQFVQQYRTGMAQAYDQELYLKTQYQRALDTHKQNLIDFNTQMQQATAVAPAQISY